MSSRFATKGQIDFALSLGAIESESQGKSLTKKAISRLIESAKQSRYQELCRIYEELDADLQRSGDILGIAEKATTLKKQGYSHWYCGPCPECGGVDRFYINVKDNLFKCGHAGGTGSGCGWGGGIAQMAAYIWKCSTWDAIDSLMGQSPRHASVASKDSVINRSPQRTPIQPEMRTNEPKPYLDFSAVLRASEERLRGPDGQVGRDFLAQRGISREAWLANHVGLVIDYKRGPAVCFPHQLVVDGSITVVSLNRRFLDDYARLAKIEKAKQMGKKIDIPKTKHVNGGRWGLYHLASVEGAHTLIMVEGEINGLSIWLIVRRCGLLATQAWRIDVVSVGSEGAFKALAPHISELAKGYKTLIIWADKFEVADKASRVIEHGDIHAIRSPIFRGKELDANDFLLRGALEDFLYRVLPNDQHIDTPDELPYIPVMPAYPVMPVRARVNFQDIFDSVQEGDEVLAPWWGDVLRIKREQNQCPPDELRGQQAGTNEDAKISLSADDSDALLWAKYAAEITPFEITPAGPPISDAPDFAAIWDEETLGPDDKQADDGTGLDSLLELCAALCSGVSDGERGERAKRWYLVIESHYMHGDFTSLLECYQAIQLAISQNRDPNFPALPPPRPNYDEYPVITDDDPFHRWVWAARAVQAGHLNYLGEAREWAGKIEDRETREQAFRETDQLAESPPFWLMNEPKRGSEATQMKLL